MSDTEKATMLEAQMRHQREKYGDATPEQIRRSRKEFVETLSGSRYPRSASAPIGSLGRIQRTMQ